MREDPSAIRGAWTPLVLAARVVLDVTWWIATPILSFGQLATGGLLALLVARVATARSVPRDPMVILGVLWVAGLGLAALRAPGLPVTWVWVAHYAGPIVVAAAVAAERPSPADLVRPALVALLGVVGLGVLLGDGWIVLHDWPRFVGAHGNVHTPAAMLAVGAPVAVTFAATARTPGDRWLGLVAAAVATLALAATFVRTAWVWALVAGLVALVVQRRLREAGGLLLTGGGLAALSGRLGTLLDAARGRAPPGGWSKLGSSRVEIWTHTLEHWLDGSPVSWLVGDGPGSHLGVHRHFEPHSEVLALLVQLGLVGLLGAGLLYVAVGRELWRSARRDPWGAVALGIWAGVMITAPLSNDFVSRTTAAWWSWALWAAARTASPRTELPRRRAE